MSGLRPAALAALCVLVWSATAQANPSHWRYEWPETDFGKHSVPFSEIRSGGPPKNGIPPIYDPKFAPLDEATDLSETEPVIGLTIDGDMRAYPLRILMWHEIVNDTVGGKPVAVTFCPLCNAAVVFDRRLAIQGEDATETTVELAFGTTGKLRKSDLVMWDDLTESWWQQFTGEAIVGALTGARLDMEPSRLESWGAFRERANTDAMVLVPNDPNMRSYGFNPYRNYDSLRQPFLYDGETPDGIEPLARVVSLGDKSQAWSVDLLRREGEIVTEDGTVLRWTPGQNSALDASFIPDGRDVGNVTAQKDGEDVLYFVDFAFAFHAFHPEAPIHTGE